VDFESQQQIPLQSLSDNWQNTESVILSETKDLTQSLSLKSRFFVPRFAGLRMTLSDGLCIPF